MVICVFQKYRQLKVIFQVSYNLEYESINLFIEVILV